MTDAEPANEPPASADDTPVDLQEELRNAEIQDVLDTLGRELIGLKPVKTRIRDRMDRFFQSNQGIRSRIAHHLDFPDYTVDELLAISRLMLADQNYRFGDETKPMFRDYITRRMQMPHFANARSIRNALDRARLRQANRLFASKRQLTRGDLMTIEPEDFLASRIFSEGRLDSEESSSSGVNS